MERAARASDSSASGSVTPSLPCRCHAAEGGGEQAVSHGVTASTQRPLARSVRGSPHETRGGSPPASPAARRGRPAEGGWRRPRGVRRGHRGSGRRRPAGSSKAARQGREPPAVSVLFDASALVAGLHTHGGILVECDEPGHVRDPVGELRDERGARPTRRRACRDRTRGSRRTPTRRRIGRRRRGTTPRGRTPRSAGRRARRARRRPRERARGREVGIG